jgi:Putative transposase
MRVALQFFGALVNLLKRDAFVAFLAPSRKVEWVVYSKRPFGVPEAMLAYLARYTHRVAISNSRLLACDAASVAFRYKDYRADGLARQKVMRLATDEFIRRFLVHVLPTGFHRIRHYGLFATGARAQNIARARELLAAPTSPEHGVPPNDSDPAEPPSLVRSCPCCGGRMTVIEIFERRRTCAASTGEFRVDTS